MPRYSVLLFSDRSPGSTRTLADRIERQVPGATVCAIVLRKSFTKTRWFRTALQSLLDLVMSVAHAFPARPAADVGVNDFVRECQQRGWPLLVVDDTDSDISLFVREHPADVAVVLERSCVAPELLALPRDGSLLVQLTTSPPDPNSANGADTFVTVQAMLPSPASPNSVSVRLHGQPFDTPVGISLKTELVSNDLILQMIGNYSAGNLHGASEQAKLWTQEVLPNCVPCPAQPGTTRTVSQMRRSRPLWKMCIHTLVLISPYVIARNWYRRWRGRFPVIILFHHLVSDRFHRMGMPTETFLRQVQFLQRYYRVVSLSEALEELRLGSTKAPTVVLTFDDGYEDNFLHMRAVLERAGVPAALFVCSKSVTARGEFQHDHDEGQHGFPSLGWEQIRYWQGGAIEFGSHTRSHFNCGSSDRDALQDEIIGSRDEIVRNLGKPVRFFAFPWGKLPNMSPTASAIATSAYDYCFSALDSEVFPNEAVRGKIVGRKFLPTSRWDLELSLQSIFGFRLGWTWGSTRQEKTSELAS